MAEILLGVQRLVSLKMNSDGRIHRIVNTGSYFFIFLIFLSFLILRSYTDFSQTRKCTLTKTKKYFSEIIAVVLDVHTWVENRNGNKFC